MKATGIQIGDWVNLSDARGEIIPCKVVELHTDELYEIQPNDTACDIVGYDMIRPLPLTPEILEKNGFRYELDYGSFYRSILGDCAKEKEPYVSIRWNSKGQVCCWEVSNKPSFMEGAVAYGYNNIAVHELQHALRLCGLDELADNFKL